MCVCAPFATGYVLDDSRLVNGLRYIRIYLLRKKQQQPTKRQRTAYRTVAQKPTADALSPPAPLSPPCWSLDQYISIGVANTNKYPLSPRHRVYMDLFMCTRRERRMKSACRCIGNWESRAPPPAAAVFGIRCALTRAHDSIFHRLHGTYATMLPHPY